MQAQTIRPASGHVFLKKRQSGARWYAKYRTPDGRQIQKALGHDWQGKGRPPTGHLNRRMAEAELRALLTDAGRGLGPQGRTGKTVADAVDEWCGRASSPSRSACSVSFSGRRRSLYRP